MTRGGSEAYNGLVEALREREYPMLKDQIYLDHAGTTLYAKSLVDRFASDMTSNLFGNPHSFSTSSQSTTSRIEDIRLRVLQFFNADPSEFDLVFVANATAGIKLVTEALRGAPAGFNYAYHQTCHTSLIGVREEARNSFCLDDVAMEHWLEHGALPGRVESTQVPVLFAYPAQSNMDGRRFPLEWSSQLRSRNPSSTGKVYTLLDASAYVATSPLDLGDSETAPDFTVLSFYKIFGFPDLGALIVRHQASSALKNRKYFGGGTVDMVVSVKEQWHALKKGLHESLEDGTLPIHNIIALDSSMDVHHRLFGTMNDVSSHTSFLSQRLHDKLSALQHGNGSFICVVYSRKPEYHVGTLGSGPVVAFNIQNDLGAWISLTEFEKLAVLKGFHVRTGGLCNPGGVAAALGLEPWEMKRNISSGFRCGTENDIMGGKPTGVIRASLGAMSTVSDVDRFVDFVNEFYRVEVILETTQLKDAIPPHNLEDLYVRDLMVYPIKSCGGYRIPKGMPWEVRPEGLAWDREWCLVHRGSGQALSQKRHPRMALLRPMINFTTGMLEISFRGVLAKQQPTSISVPLSADPTFFQNTVAAKRMASRVCGEEISAQTYTSATINDFFSNILGVSCALARFPPGGQGKRMRYAKAHLQQHQNVGNRIKHVNPWSFLEIVTPPDSDSETENRKILLSNESPILAINLSSLEVLNQAIVERGGKPVSPEVFRANVVIGASTWKPDSFAYSEDHWSRLKIGQQDFKMLGSCRRCHMVCIDQETAAKGEEPFITLTKTRRFEGKVFFGTHMCHTPSTDSRTREAQYPAIQVGDTVVVDAPS
ncbi:MOSC N-terminal beta barrel domain-containing protein [Pseudomassariella vexata]|uniref:Molybdenum cofactor sulfurase n=1 Tax=Pseudomassariella vexata TaxID=1141098 RepID=A0A1Y2DS88_9PEZI|nr:MOSC N-terminal beta barrel domain-containing protein [Pseudomassariella vexata]ORY62138.1 MOSC N-terminal beta barrel domain-containing protein [Pseudomassariella vexata]